VLQQPGKKHYQDAFGTDLIETVVDKDYDDVVMILKEQY
jgi:hypothetical protein